MFTNYQAHTLAKAPMNPLSTTQPMFLRGDVYHGKDKHRRKQISDCPQGLEIIGNRILRGVIGHGYINQMVKK